MGGRLFPMLAWYVCMAEKGRAPECTPHDLIVDPLVRITCTTWLFGVPALALGLAFGAPWLTSAASLALLVGVAANGVHLVAMLRRAKEMYDV